MTLLISMYPARRPPTGLQSYRARGFTIIELLITVAILVILIGLAAPSLSNLVRDQRVKTAVGDVYAALVFARSEAIKRNATVNVVSPASDWAGGWEVRAGVTVLNRQDALGGINIDAKDQITDAAITTVSYLGDGRLSTASGRPTFNLKSSESGTTTTARCVRLDLSGRPNVKVDTNNNPADGCQ